MSRCEECHSKLPDDQGPVCDPCLGIPVQVIDDDYVPEQCPCPACNGECNCKDCVP